MDGIWKLRFAHCMFPVKAEVCGIENINYPSVCTEQPSTPRSAFCVRHCDEADKKGIQDCGISFTSTAVLTGKEKVCNILLKKTVLTKARVVIGYGGSERVFFAAVFVKR